MKFIDVLEEELLKFWKALKDHHHPHSLANPSRIVDFILKSVAGR